MITEFWNNYRPSFSGLYIVRDGEHVLYVGKAINIKTRFNSHHIEAIIYAYFPFATIEFVEMDRRDLTRAEYKLIKELKPLFTGSRKAQWDNKTAMHKLFGKKYWNSFLKTYHSYTGVRGGMPRDIWLGQYKKALNTIHTKGVQVGEFLSRMQSEL